MNAFPWLFRLECRAEHLSNRLSPSRCQAAAVVLFFALVVSGWLVFQLITAVVGLR